MFYFCTFLPPPPGHKEPEFHIMVFIFTPSGLEQAILYSRIVKLNKCLQEGRTGGVEERMVQKQKWALFYGSLGEILQPNNFYSILGQLLLMRSFCKKHCQIIILLGTYYFFVSHAPQIIIVLVYEHQVLMCTIAFKSPDPSVGSVLTSSPLHSFGGKELVWAWTAGHWPGHSLCLPARLVSRLWADCSPADLWHYGKHPRDTASQGPREGVSLSRSQQTRWLWIFLHHMCYDRRKGAKVSRIHNSSTEASGMLCEFETGRGSL